MTQDEALVLARTYVRDLPADHRDPLVVVECWRCRAGLARIWPTPAGWYFRHRYQSADDVVLEVADRVGRHLPMSRVIHEFVLDTDDHEDPVAPVLGPLLCLCGERLPFDDDAMRIAIAEARRGHALGYRYTVHP